MLLKVVNRIRIRIDPATTVQRRKVRVQLELRGSVKPVDLLRVNRGGKSRMVIDADIPRGVSARPSLDLGAQSEEHEDADLVKPAKLVLLLLSEVIRCRLR